MKNSFGNSLILTLFGESHGECIGAVLDGLAPGIEIDTDYIKEKLNLRKPDGITSTKRIEKDEFRIVSGVFNGYTTGTPLCILIPNENTVSADYDKTKSVIRPSHADLTANYKYHGFEDKNGGGHFSGRITAALVAAGAVLTMALEKKGIFIGTHIKSLGKTQDDKFSDYLNEVKILSNKKFAVLNDEKGEEMKKEILKTAEKGDSIGGILETAVVGMEKGAGEPWFDTVESTLSHILFSVPAVKGVEFGLGFDFAKYTGSEANDRLRIKNGEIEFLSNNNGGVLGGITSGEPIVFRTAVKPTPTISLPQETVDLKKNENTVLECIGRHDPSIVSRVSAVINSVSAIAIYDILATRFGTDWINS